MTSEPLVARLRKTAVYLQLYADTPGEQGTLRPADALIALQREAADAIERVEALLSSPGSKSHPYIHQSAIRAALRGKK